MTSMVIAQSVMLWATVVVGGDTGPAPHALVAWAALPAAARTPGPTSGQFIQGANGVPAPFKNGQPIPGWSGLLDDGDGSFIAMPDNGFGGKGNSADYVLGWYKVKPAFKTTSDGTTTPGSVVVKSFTALNDRKGLLKNGAGVDLTIVADRANYVAGPAAGAPTGIAVDARIRDGRLLTGADFDVESIARAKDGTFWIGDEFGPYLLHVDAHGTLLDEPVPHPVLQSPENPEVLAGRATATQGGGFESLAFDPGNGLLYTAPETAPLVDALRPVPGDERVLQIFELDPAAKAYTGRTFKYRKDGSATGNAILIGDMTNVAPGVFVLIERDGRSGAKAVTKRLYIIDLKVTDADGVLAKRLLVDLLDIDDPRDIGGPLPGLAAKKFKLPFNSVECVANLGANTLGVAVDTNYPFEAARVPGVADATEIIKLQFDRPVASYAPKAR